MRNLLTSVGRRKAGLRERHGRVRAESHIAAEFIAKKRTEGRVASTRAKTEWLIGIAKAILGPRPTAEITAPEILKALRVVEARERLETARRLRATIGAIFRYAVATGRAGGDPTSALQGALATAIVQPEGLGGLLRAIEGHSGTPEVRYGLPLLALAFVRRGELRSATWGEIDFEAAVWTIPAERMKIRRPHRVPLSRQALAVLRNAEAISTGALIFQGRRGRDRAPSENTFNAASRPLSFTKDEMTARGFRAAASSILNESELWNADAIEAQFAHVEGNAVRRAYARAEFWDERVRMMQWQAHRLDERHQARQII